MDLRKLSRALDLFAVFDPTHFPIHFVQVFLLVAASRSCTYREIEEALSITNSSVSRTINALARVHRSGLPGLGLVEPFIDPQEGRRYRVRLTSKGRALLRQIEAI
jgi:DNA-binding MarR family transcriptional regulator